jgi:tetratricopeptide (TPR) repeat protein
MTLRAVSGNHPSRWSVAAAIAIVVAALAPSNARAADNRSEARRHFEVGVEEAKSGAYREALVEFTRAYELSPHFAVLYNIATANAALGDPAAALNFFERYLSEGGAAVASERRAKIEVEMSRLAPRTAYLNLHALPATARLSLDGAPLPADPSGRAIRVNIGVHRVSAALDGYAPIEQSATIASGDVANLTLQLVPLAPAPAPVAALAAAPAPPAAPLAAGASASGGVLATPASPALAAEPSPQRSGTVQRVVGYTAGGLGLVSFAVAALLYYYDAKSNLQRAIDLKCTVDMCVGEGAAHWRSAQNDVAASRIALATGGVLVAAGVALVMLAPSPGPSPSASSTGGHNAAPAPAAVLGAMLGPAGPTGLTLTGRF